LARNLHFFCADDPEISEMIAQKRFLDLLRDQRIIDAANDLALAERIKNSIFRPRSITPLSRN